MLLAPCAWGGMRGGLGSAECLEMGGRCGLVRLGAERDDGVFALRAYAVLAAPDAYTARDIVLRSAATVVAV